MVQLTNVNNNMDRMIGGYENIEGELSGARPQLFLILEQTAF